MPTFKSETLAKAFKSHIQVTNPLQAESEIPKDKKVTFVQNMKNHKKSI